MKEEITDALKLHGLEGARLLATKASLKIYEGKLQEKPSFELKMHDMLNYVLDEIEYGRLSASSSELEYTSYWTKIFNFLLRNSGVLLKISEASSAATKIDREINEFEYNKIEQKNIMGRKIDLLFVGDLKKCWRSWAGPAEIKPANATADVVRIDLNKNIRTTKSIRNNIKMLVNDSSDTLDNIGMMIIGK